MSEKLFILKMNSNKSRHACPGRGAFLIYTILALSTVTFGLSVPEAFQNQTITNITSKLTTTTLSSSSSSSSSSSLSSSSSSSPASLSASEGTVFNCNNSLLSSGPCSADNVRARQVNLTASNQTSANASSSNANNDTKSIVKPKQLLTTPSLPPSSESSLTNSHSKSVDTPPSKSGSTLLSSNWTVATVTAGDNIHTQTDPFLSSNNIVQTNHSQGDSQ